MANIVKYIVINTGAGDKMYATGHLTQGTLGEMIRDLNIQNIDATLAKYKVKEVK